MKVYTLLISFICAGFGVFAQNTFTGTYAGKYCTGYDNTFSGYASGYIQDGHDNTFMGYKSGLNPTEFGNVAIGHESIFNTTAGSLNTFFGTRSGYVNSGSLCTFVGDNSGVYNTSSHNTFLGYGTGLNNTTGSGNTFIGSFGGFGCNTGKYNTSIGSWAGPGIDDLENTIAIGSTCYATASNQALIGNTSTNLIGGQVRWTVLSDGRFKKNMRQNVPGLDFVKELRPVSYEIDVAAINKFHRMDTIKQYSNKNVKPILTTGFVAQEVEKLVNEKNYAFYGIISPQNDKDHYSIRYSEFVVPLVKAVQELKNIIEDQRKEINELRTAIINSAAGNISQNSYGARLYQNRPDSYMSATPIEMFLPQDISKAELLILDMNGRIQKTIPVGERGNTSIIIEEGTLKSGDYICALIIDGSMAQSKKLILTE